MLDILPSEIINMIPINEVDISKCIMLAESIKNKGWVGAPILVSKNYNMLITGSHRQRALQILENEGFDIDSLGYVGDNVDDLIERWSELEQEYGHSGSIDDFPFNCLSDAFEDTRVEDYEMQYGFEEWF